MYIFMWTVCLCLLPTFLLDFWTFLYQGIFFTREIGLLPAKHTAEIFSCFVFKFVSGVVEFISLFFLQMGFES